MDGLLSGVLPAVYSASDRLKRSVNYLLNDPKGWMESKGQTMATDAAAARGLLADATDESIRSMKDGGPPLAFGPANQRAAQSMADAYIPGAISVANQMEALRRLEAMKRGETVDKVLRGALVTTPDQQSVIDSAYKALTSGRQPARPTSSTDIHLGHLYDARMSGEIKANGKRADTFKAHEVTNWLAAAGDDSAVAKVGLNGKPYLESMYFDPERNASYAVQMPISGNFSTGAQWVSGLVPDGIFSTSKKKNP